MKNQKSSQHLINGHTGNAPNEGRRIVVASLYNSGLSIRAIATIAGVSFQAVHSMLKRMNVEMRQRGGNSGSHSRHKK